MFFFWYMYLFSESTKWWTSVSWCSYKTRISWSSEERLMPNLGLSSTDNPFIWSDFQFRLSPSLTVKLTKPWTPEIFVECYCVARNKPIRREKTKPQTTTVINLCFWGLLAYPELYCDWPVHNQHSWNFSGVHGFLSLTVIHTWIIRARQWNLRIKVGQKLLTWI